jgi:presenilin-like A22 family membrane protease
LYFDVLLPSVLFLVITGSIVLQRILERTISSLLEERKLSVREVALTVAWMGVAVTAMVFIPGEAIRIVFLAAYSYMLFSFTYIALKRWYVAVLPPALFLLAYFFYWNLIVFNVFVIIFSVIITVYASGLFSWRTVWIFAVLLTIMDVIQVFGTGFMGQSAEKMIGLKLPVLLMLPTFPSGLMIGLGLGDLFLAGLLSIHASANHGTKAGVLTALMNSIAMLVFEVALLNTMMARFFPATLVVMAGSLAGLGLTHLLNWD